jgi:hypothetical protein
LFVISRTSRDLFGSGWSGLCTSFASWQRQTTLNVTTIQSYIVNNPSGKLTMQAYIVDNPTERLTMQRYIVDNPTEKLTMQRYIAINLTSGLVM